jgi:lipid-A-disaccharide synthase
VKILISAAETSSDAHGAQLLRALKAQSQEKIEAFGIGGPRLQAEGLRVVVDAQDLLAMGFQEILGRLPKIFRALNDLTEAAKNEQPDVAVVIDYPDFHFRLARRLKKQGIPVIYYIPPKIWAWRKSRIRTLKKLFVKVLSILPFEESFYRSEGVAVKYVGNPLVDELPLELKKVDARKKLGLNSEKVLVIMPGSRPAELKQHFDLMLQSAWITATELERAKGIGLGEKLKVLLPIPWTASLATMHLALDQWIQSFKIRGVDPQQRIDIHLSQGDAHICLIAADVGIIKSGTSTLEAGVLGCPHSIVYKPGRLTTWIYRNLVRYRGAVGLVNLVAGGLGQKKEDFLLREILLDEATPETIAQETVSLFLDNFRRDQIQVGLAQLRKTILGQEHDRGVQLQPSRAAADEILQWVECAQKSFQDSRSNPKRSAIRWIVSAGWSTLSLLARLLVRFGFLKATRLGSRVISVGNIQAGGTGKTPIVAQIARQAHERGLQVAILTRGYRSKWEWSGGVISPDSEVAPETQLCGDEAALLHELAPHAWIGVGADRISCYQEVSRQLGRQPDWVILDDGFQHWKIHKDVEIVAVTSWTRAQAFFREWASALKYADLLIWTKGNVRPKSYEKPMVKLGFYLQSPTVETSLGLILITGLGDPESARKAVLQAGYRIEKHLSFSREMAWNIFSNLKNSGLRLAMTGKDWVKWREFGIPQAEVLVFEPELIFEEGLEVWEQVLWK